LSSSCANASTRTNTTPAPEARWRCCITAVGLARLPEVEPLKEVIVPVVADDNSVDMGAFTLPQYVMAYDIKGFGVVGYEPFIRPVGAAVDQFACTGC